VVLTADAAHVRASGRPIEVEAERPPVTIGPIANDIGHDPSIVVGRQLKRLFGGPREIDAV
jgi:hypothetical protein